LLIRRAHLDDAQAISRVHVETWRRAYVGQIPDEYLESLNADQRVAVWNEHLADPNLDTFIADNDGSIVGFASLGVSRDSDADRHTGELQSIYVLPDYWRLGIGAALCREVLSRASQRHFASVTLWVLETNQQARSFYEAHGFGADGATKHERRSPTLELKEIRYRCNIGSRVV
jgi:ribosomal protein S18 acetylase RimI-like enzyme